MARSPFQGTWQDGIRPTVVTAPDALVYINGELDILGCGKCRRRFDLGKYITSISVDLSVESAPGSASISLSIPRHTVDEFFLDGNPLITPMMEVEIYAKGYYLVEGLPQYYPIFWGLVTQVDDSYSGGENTVNISCSDILKWWELCKMNINPAFTQAAGQLGRNYITGNLFNANVYDIIWTLAQQSFGDVVQATGSLVSSFQEQRQKDTFNRAMGGIINYWNQRFTQMRSNLLLYGVKGSSVRGDVLYEAQRSPTSGLSGKWASQAVRQANGGPDSGQLFFSPDTVIPFRSNLSNAGQPNMFQSEYQSKLEIANACKEAVGFEFFMDVTGDIVFKPPFYNLDVLSNKPVSWIQDIDVIDYSFSESEAEVITHLQMQGSYEGGAMDMGVTSDFNTPFAQVIDYHLLQKYGWRTQTYNAEFISGTQALFYTGLDILDKTNAKRFRGTASIPLRPELRLGFPVYVAPKDQIWYLQGINHNIQFGGRASTSLTLSAKRSKFVAPRGIGTLELIGFKSGGKKDVPLVDGLKPSTQELSRSGSFKLAVGDAAQLPPSNPVSSGGHDPYAPLLLRHPKTGRIVGYPNVTMAYTKPFSPTSSEMRRAAGQKPPGAQRIAKKISSQESDVASEQNLRISQQGLVQDSDRDLVDRHMTNRYMYGMTSAGVYSYVHDIKKVVQELVLLPAKNIQASVSGEGVDAAKLLGTTASIRPISDERGFELIGHYRYGRGVSLRDGSLVLSDEGNNTRAAVSTQFALSGGLFEALAAQTAGLTTISTGHVNPVDAFANLQPEDLQTGAFINPESGAIRGSSEETNFVDTAPLGSPEQKGVPTSVEASQLSMGLTLAEMAPTDIEERQDCDCLSNRADLAFINVGYQIDYLGSTAPDTSTLIGVEGELQDIQAELERLEADPSSETDPTIIPYIQSLRERRDAIRSQDTSNFSLTSNMFAPSRRMTVTRVEEFLANLYSALDEPHQQYEKALRGDLIPGGFTRDQIISGETGQGDRFGDFKPPFSPGGRALGGDLEALTHQGESSMANLANSWKRFGQDIQREPEKARLQQEIQQLERKLSDLDLEEKRLEGILESGSTALSPDGSPESRLESVREEQSKAFQDLQNARAKLQNLHNEEINRP